MIKKHVFLFIFILFFSLNNIFAQDAKSDAKTEDIDSLAALRQKSMDKEIQKLMGQRESVMDEEINKIERKRETGEAILNLNFRKIDTFQPVLIKDSNGLGNFFSIKNTRNALGFSFELEDEERKILSATIPSHRKRLLFEESLETKFNGSVYHPNLVNFDVDLEAGLSQNKEKFQPNLTGELKNSTLNQYHILSSFLDKKPYAFSFSADKSREFQNREFFERQVINNNRFSGNFGFKNSVLPARFSFSNSETKIGRISLPSQNSRDDQLGFNLSNQSDLIGDTFFDATRDEFSRMEEGTFEQKGISNDFSLTNRKYLTSDERRMLYSSLRFYDITGTGKSRVLNFDENYNIKHTDYLNSTYTYSFSDKTSQDVKAKDNRISASLRHRLYESLNSVFNTYYFNSNATSFSQDTYGASLDESYQKKLGKIGKLSSGVGIGYSEDKRKIKDNIISIIDETQTLTTGILTFLDMPRVDTATVVVTNTPGAITYVLNVDYLLTAVGERTQIQRIPAGSISDGQAVLVDYHAMASPLLKFNTLSENYSLRIDFLDQLIGVFYKLAHENHPKIYGGEDLILQKLKDTTIGFDFSYKNLSIELSDEYYDSSLSPYKQKLIKESFFFNPTEKSALTFNSSQSKVKLVESADTQKFFDFITRFSAGLNAYSRFTVEAGFRWQKGTGIDLNDITAGSGYELSLNKFLLNLNYEFRKQLYFNDSLINHFFSFKAKRIF